MGLLRDSFIEILYLSTLCHKTKELLMEYMAKGGQISSDGVEYLATFTLSHIDDMQEGFKWTLRASDADLAELRYLLHQADVFDWEGVDEVTLKARTLIPPELRKIQALQHAKVVLGIMPRMPQTAVTYPLAKSYADIPAPQSPAELAERIEELERMIWETAMQRAFERLDKNSYRRTFGFFDAATWLAVQHMRLFSRGKSSETGNGGQLPN